ncbi:MAG: DNA gyrase inhibitor YacG [Xanthobacteraceae bacterium]
MPETAKHKCPICGKPAVDTFRPFCSRRCADVDLNRWFSGIYTVPGSEDAEEQETPPSDDARG